MEESSTYQALLSKGRAQGRVEEARAVVVRLGRKKFGAPLPAVVEAVEAITDIARLEELSDRLLDVDSWDELMADPGRGL